MNTTIYICVNKDECLGFLTFLRKYDVGCVGTNCILTEKLTYKREYFKYGHNTVILKFEVDRDRIYCGDYSPYLFGERLFNFTEIENRFAANLMAKDRELRKKYFNDGNPYKYKTDRYFMYKMYEALPFTDDEYDTICRLDEFDYYELKEQLEENEKIDIRDIFNYELMRLEPLEPETEYMDRIGAVLDIVDNEIKSSTRYPEDESKALINIDLLSIKKELGQAAKENKVNISVAEKSLSIKFNDTFKVISPVRIKELKEFYPLIYDDSEYLKIRLARELRKFETNCFY